MFNLHIYIVYCLVVATGYEEHRPTNALTC